MLFQVNVLNELAAANTNIGHQCTNASLPWLMLDGPLDPEVCQQSLWSQAAECIYKQASSPQTHCLENRSHRNANTTILSLIWGSLSKQDTRGTLRR